MTASARRACIKGRRKHGRQKHRRIWLYDFAGRKTIQSGRPADQTQQQRAGGGNHGRRQDPDRYYPKSIGMRGQLCADGPQGKSAPAVGALHGGARLPGSEAKFYSPGKIRPLQSPAVCEKHAANPAALPHHGK